MKWLLLIVMGLLLLSSCSSDYDGHSPTESTLVSKWNLVARYADPGECSGNFSTVTGLKTVQFEADGSLSSNADLCQIFSETGEPSTTNYSETEATITMNNCLERVLVFELSNSSLILNYPCIEGCKEKYEKRNN